MRIFSLLLVCTVCSVLTLSSCGSRKTITTDTMRDLIGVDITALDKAAQHDALKRISAITETDAARNLKENSAASYRVCAANHGAAIIYSGHGAIDITGLNEHGLRIYSNTLIIPQAPLQLTNITEHTALGTSLITTTLPSTARLTQKVIWALTVEGAVLVAAEDANQRSVITELSTDLPELELYQGRLQTVQPALTLAALVRLVNPQGAAERSQDGVRSTLQELSHSTDLWTARAAAKAVTLTKQ